MFQPLSAEVFKQKIRRSEIIKPVKQVELLHHEVQDLSKLHPDTNLTPCPLCCRAFRSKLGACKHVILCHENYKENRQKEKFQSNLKSAVDVRVTSLSKLLLNKLSPLEIIKQATEIVVRDPNISGEELEESSEDEILERKKHRDQNISGEESDESSEDDILVRKRRREPDLL